jgi:putative ATP-dependent endonuclease of the OLD family
MDNDLTDIQILGKNFKSIGDNEVGFEQIFPINVLIGRNNSGKSALLDMVECVLGDQKIGNQAHKNNGGLGTPYILISRTIILTIDVIRRLYNQLPRTRRDGKTILGEKLILGIKITGDKRLGEFQPLRDRCTGFSEHEWSILGGRNSENEIARNNPLLNKIFKRISAERDIVPENKTKIARGNDAPIDSKGNGVTNLIRAYLNEASWNHGLVEDFFLSRLNEIVQPDMHFERIEAYETDDKWEISLQETSKGMIPLSQSGSGLKTIILVLAHLHLATDVAQKPLSSYVFGFEELENNLHPTMQRRLFSYLRKIALDEGCIFFLTTHSNIPIDIFSAEKHAQILHVTHDGESTSVIRASGYIEKRDILDDLGLRASDLLQANAIVWVEGPSDRIYFNRWVEIWTNGELKEGTHYHCMLYGGRLLSHFSGDNPESAPGDLIKLLHLNQHSLLIADSDCKSGKDTPNATKQRLAAEINSIGGRSWITAGKEIENYLPVQALREYHQQPDLLELNRYQSFPNYLDAKVESGLGKRFERQKPMYAREIAPLFTRENLSTVLDLSERLDEFVALIQKWNGTES